MAAFENACARKPSTRDLIPPNDQLTLRLEGYVGDPAPPMAPEQIKLVSTEAEGIFEFRTTDTRLVGWFAFKDVFIGVEAFLKADLGALGGMKVVKGRVFAARASLDLDPPKHVGGSYASVLG